MIKLDLNEETYQEGKWEVNVKSHEDNDRIDEGDWMENSEEQYNVKLASPLNEFNVYDVFKGENLVAKVRGSSPENRMVIPLRELNDSEEDELYQFIDGQIFS